MPPKRSSTQTTSEDSDVEIVEALNTIKNAKFCWPEKANEQVDNLNLADDILNVPNLSQQETQLPVLSPDFLFTGDSDCSITTLLPCKPFGPPRVEPKPLKTFDPKPSPARMHWKETPNAVRFKKSSGIPKEALKKGLVVKLKLINCGTKNFDKYLEQEESDFIKDMYTNELFFDEDTNEIVDCYRRARTALTNACAEFDGAVIATCPPGPYSDNHKVATSRIVRNLRDATRIIEEITRALSGDIAVDLKKL